MPLALESDLGIGNRLQLLDDEILANLNDVQLRSGLRPSESLESGDFTAERTTGGSAEGGYPTGERSPVRNAFANGANLAGRSQVPGDRLPPLPARSGPGQLATLAATADGIAQALVVERGTLTVWQLDSGQWARQQTVRVSLPYGSSD